VRSLAFASSRGNLDGWFPCSPVQPGVSVQGAVHRGHRGQYITQPVNKVVDIVLCGLQSDGLTAGGSELASTFELCDTFPLPLPQSACRFRRTATSQTDSGFLC
jgi:hypothetical protein